MAITTYAELKTAVANWLARSDLTSYIPDFIALAQKRVNRELRIKAMETTLTGTITSGVIAVSADYLELKHARISSTSPTQPLERKESEWIYYNYPTRSADGLPKFIAQDDGNFIFGPYPDSAYDVSGIYYKGFTLLSADADTNWVFTYAPGLYLWGALAEAAPFVGNDPRALTWEAKYAADKASVVEADNRGRYSGSPLAVTAR